MTLPLAFSLPAPLKFLRNLASGALPKPKKPARPFSLPRAALGLLLFLAAAPSFGFTRTGGLPTGFVWSYYPDAKETQPRGGSAWRAGLMLSNRIYLLSTEGLSALDFNGNLLWAYAFPAEGMSSEAKLLPLGSSLVAVTTDRLIKVDMQTGELQAQYGTDTRKRAAFQRTLILPRSSFAYEGYIYGFLGPSLLRFGGETLEREDVKDFSSSPKTLPLVYEGSIAVGLDNGFFQLYNPLTDSVQTLIGGSPRADFRIRQPAIHRGLLFVPTSDELMVFQGSELFARSTALSNAQLSGLDGRLWMRAHNSGVLTELDETLSTLGEGRYASPLRAGLIDAPLAGTSNRLLHLEALNGAFTVIDAGQKIPPANGTQAAPQSGTQAAPQILKTAVTEDFGDNPPLQILGSFQNLILLGGFDGLFLIDLDKF